MALVTSSQFEGERRSAFGFLRLFLASLVIVSHATELVDGNRSREPLTQAFGTISFGDLAVDGFFLISGYLIVGSYLQYPNAIAYLRKRIARIYPAFIVASFVTLTIVASLAGADMDWISHNVLVLLSRVLLLHQPEVPHAFVGQANHHTNGAMWTIAYEFRCYLLVLFLAALGLLRRPRMIFALAALSFAAFEYLPVTVFSYLDRQVYNSELWFGASQETLRFTAMFLMGAVFYLQQHRMKFVTATVVSAMLLLVGCLFVTKLAEPGVAVFGGYILFATAAWGAARGIGKINSRTDISYGVYLYAWPTAQLLIRFCPAQPAAFDGIVTAIVAMGCGWISWTFIEQPALRAVSRTRAKKRDRTSGRYPSPPLLDTQC